MMKVPTVIFYILFSFLSVGCASQNKIKTAKKNYTDTSKIYIRGSICLKQTQEQIPFVSYILQLSDTGNIYRGSVRQGIADKSGKFKIDITTLVDSTNTFVLRSLHVNSAVTHVIIKGRIKKSIDLKMEVIEGSGDFYVYYRVNRKSRLKLVNQVIKVSSGAIE